MKTRNGKNTNGGVHILDGVPQSLVHGAEEGATKLAEAVELAGARVAKGAGQASGRAGELSGQIKGRVATAPLEVKARRKMMRAIAKRRKDALTNSDAMLKAQLAKTSRDLAHESSDLSTAVDSLNKIIKSNRRAAAKGRTRLLGGLALGALLTYHLDAEHGRERRAATARLLTNMVRGERRPPPPVS